jgi:hypothetical protein
MPAGSPPPPFLEGVHFYYENGRMVLTARYLLDRGYCCGNGCRHCPYGDGKTVGPAVPDSVVRPAQPDLREYP